MKNNYVAPAIDRTAFHCPVCGTKAPQMWLDCYAKKVENGVPELETVKKLEHFLGTIEDDRIKPSEETIAGWKKESEAAEAGDLRLKELTDGGTYCYYDFGNIFFSVCQEASCGKASLWIHNKLIIPSSSVEESPNEDMPDTIKAIYNEAREVHKASPRASAALLRLCCEMLCNHLKAKGKGFNEQIGYLVSKGMDERIQKALDVLRFIGNDSIHPGQIDLKDDQDTSHALFVLVNEIVQETISKPKRLEALYTEKLPEGVRDAIKKRDAASKAG